MKGINILTRFMVVRKYCWVNDEGIGGVGFTFWV